LPANVQMNNVLSKGFVHPPVQAAPKRYKQRGVRGGVKEKYLAEVDKPPPVVQPLRGRVSKRHHAGLKAVHSDTAILRTGAMAERMPV
jgi:hypothetical protein